MKRKLSKRTLRIIVIASFGSSLIAFAMASSYIHYGQRWHLDVVQLRGTTIALPLAALVVSLIIGQYAARKRR